MLSIKELNLPNNKTISFDLMAGAQIEIVGPNGVGKSLLLKSIAYLQEWSYREFLYNNKPISAFNLNQYRSEVIYFHPKPFLIEATFEQNLQFPFTFIANKNKSYNRSFTLEILNELKVSEKILTKQSSQLSSGEALILSFIRGVLLNPKAFILDEPTSALDKEKKKTLISIIKKICKTLVIVTHDETSQFEKRSFDSLVFCN